MEEGLPGHPTEPALTEAQATAGLEPWGNNGEGFLELEDRENAVGEVGETSKEKNH